MDDPILTEKTSGDQDPPRRHAGAGLYTGAGLAVLVAVYLALAIALFGAHTFPLLGETDGIGYMKRAAGPVWQADPFHGPGYSFAIRVVAFFGIDLFAAAKIVSLFFGLVMLLVVRRLVAAITGDEEGWGAVLVLMINPLFLLSSVSIMSDMTATTLLLASLALLVVPREPRKMHIVLAGALAGGAYLTRYVYILGLAFPLLAWAFKIPRYKYRNERVLDTLDFVIGFLVVAAPWMFYLLFTKGNPFWNLNYLNVAFKMLEGGQGWNYFPTTEEFHGWIDVIASNPALFLATWWGTLQSLPARVLQFYPGLWFVVLLGALVWLLRFNRRKAVTVAAISIYAVLVSLVWLRDRFLLLFIPVVASMMASAVSLVPATVLSRLPLRRVALAVMLLAISMLAIRSVPPAFESAPLEYKAAAEWLSSVASYKTTVLAPKPHIAFFSDTRNMDFRGYGMQEAEPVDLPAILADARPDFVVYDERYALLQFPFLENLLYPALNPYPDLLTCVFVVNEPMTLVIYEYNR